MSSTEYADNIYWVYGLVLNESLGTAESAMAKLAKAGVGTRPFFYPMHLQPVLKKMGLFNEGDYPVSERLYRQGFYIPSGLGLTESQIFRVSEIVKQILNEVRK